MISLARKWARGSSASSIVKIPPPGVRVMTRERSTGSRIASRQANVSSWGAASGPRRAMSFRRLTSGPSSAHWVTPRRLTRTRPILSGGVRSPNRERKPKIGVAPRAGSEFLVAEPLGYNDLHGASFGFEEPDYASVRELGEDNQRPRLGDMSRVIARHFDQLYHRALEEGTATQVFPGEAEKFLRKKKTHGHRRLWRHGFRR